MRLHIHLRTGRDLDYTLNTDRVTFVPGGNPAIVNITLHEDGIMHEGEETLQLKLELESDVQGCQAEREPFALIITYLT